MEWDYLQSTCGVDAHRIVMGEPSPRSDKNASVWRENAPWITFFTEPYEADFWRADAIFREVLPRLCAVARRARKTVVLKLHPFESARQRTKLVKRVLSEADRKCKFKRCTTLRRHSLAHLVRCDRGVYCGVRMCDSRIPAFLCGWLRHAYAGMEDSTCALVPATCSTSRRVAADPRFRRGVFARLEPDSPDAAACFFQDAVGCALHDRRSLYPLNERRISIGRSYRRDKPS